eukprot:CCRYP_010772-RA/>CCRYP_010772-RA protein AED:0.48 eAED:0.64 QI:255/0/0.5/1/1/1/2/0/69
MKLARGKHRKQKKGVHPVSEGTKWLKRIDPSSTPLTPNPTANRSREKFEVAIVVHHDPILNSQHLTNSI